MSDFNIKYFLVWRETKTGLGTLPAGRQEIVKDEWHKTVNREELAQAQAEMMNGIYGQGSHWIESE